MSTTIIAPQSEDLTPEERQERAEQCQGIERNIKESISHGREALIDLSRYLYEFDQVQGWLALGYENQGEWLAQPDIGLQRTQFFRAVRRHRELVVYRDVPMETLRALEPSKVDIVLGAIQDNRVQLREALDDVEALGARDLREKYIGTKAPSPGPQLDEDGNPVIEGTAKEITIDDKPVKASDVSSNGSGPVGEAEKALHAAAVVDSWVSVGGDKRKAHRNWTKFRETHPAFVAAVTVEQFFEGAEDVSKEDVKTAWSTLTGALDLSFPS